MESEKNVVFIETENTTLEAMLSCLSYLFYRYGIKEIDSISCDKESKRFRVHFTKTEDSKRFENNLRFEIGSLLKNLPPNEEGKSKNIKVADETNKEQARVGSSSRSSGETGPSIENTPKQAAKRNRGKAIPDSTTGKQNTTQDDVRKVSKQKKLTDTDGWCDNEKKKAGTSERKSDENSKSTSADEKEIINLPSTSTLSGSPQIDTPTTSQTLGVADTNILSNELQGYIDDTCKITGALKRSELDSFLGHAKQKNKPTELALQFTDNVEQLKNQLQMIVKLYYGKSPTKKKSEDTAFIKWLKNLILRLNNT